MSVPHNLHATSTGPRTSTRGSHLNFRSRSADLAADKLERAVEEPLVGVMGVRRKEGYTKRGF